MLGSEPNSDSRRSPLFSIGVTTYDRVGLLIETLESILAQTFEDFEVIVANDNPKRTVTAEMLGVTDPRIRFVNNPQTLGELANMNSLLAQSTGRYFTWIADDDLYAPDFLECAFQALERFDYPSCVFTSFDVMNKDRVDHPRHHSGTSQLYTGSTFLDAYLQQRIRTMGVMGLYDREYLVKQGGLRDVSADGMGLYCEYLLIIDAGVLDRVAFIDRPLCFYRIHDMSWSYALNVDADQYRRAGVNLTHLSIERFQQSPLLANFNANLTALLRWCLGEYSVAVRRSESYGWKDLLVGALKATDYISPLKNTPRLWSARVCMVRAQVWLLWTLMKQAMFAIAPRSILKVFSATRSFLHRQSVNTS